MNFWLFGLFYTALQVYCAQGVNIDELYRQTQVDMNNLGCQDTNDLIRKAGENIRILASYDKEFEFPYRLSNLDQMGEEIANISKITLKYLSFFFILHFRYVAGYYQDLEWNVPHSLMEMLRNRENQTELIFEAFVNNFFDKTRNGDKDLDSWMYNVRRGNPWDDNTILSQFLQSLTAYNTMLQTLDEINPTNKPDPEEPTIYAGITLFICFLKTLIKLRDKMELFWYPNTISITSLFESIVPPYEIWAQPYMDGPLRAQYISCLLDSIPYYIIEARNLYEKMSRYCFSG